MNGEKISEILIKWYKKNKRTFSWRTQELTPFQFLVAELMLQKTGANQVEKIFMNFINKFPTPETIVDAPQQVLEDEFQPLGLFRRRARDLKRLSESILEKNGVIPKTQKELTKLPGVGNYIANAVLCFAFNQNVPLVDANIARIIERVFTFQVKGAPTRDKNLWKKVEELVPSEHVKEFNFALLDLGALICTPKKPKCDACPLNDICDFFTKKLK
ncbi:MAG: hypothetical protein HWN65_03005 [Candidatus Helarchaeota archaeon]|nr:hypothetical protein [Candidatus Helarchaeota archaeon]